MEDIGKKIKRLRKENDFSQGNLHNNQSAVAQIELGKNQNPTAETLRIIANNLDISFEQLVESTDWRPSNTRDNEVNYGYSELYFDLELKNNGQIKIRFKSFPRYDLDGQENKFCPKTGSKLLFHCKACKKPIISKNHTYCMRCGKKIFNSFPDSIDGYLASANKIIEQKELNISNGQDWYAFPQSVLEDLYENDLDPWIFQDFNNSRKKLGLLIEYFRLLEENIYRSYRPESMRDELNHYFVKGMDDSGIIQQLSFFLDSRGYLDDIGDLNINEWVKGFDSDSSAYVNLHMKLHFDEIFFKKITEELKKYRNGIVFSSDSEIEYINQPQKNHREEEEE